MNEYSVYKHTFPNGKVYIGITRTSVSKRWNGGIGYKSQTLMFRAITKYGWDNIKHEVLFDSLTKEDAEDEERRLIAEYRSCDPNYGYNVETGGNVGKKLAESTKQKISDSRKGKRWDYFRGRHHTEESKRLLSEAHKGKLADGKSPLCKMVEQVDSYGDVVAIYKSLTIAANSIGIKKGTMSEAIKNHRMSRGYYWRWHNV